MVGYIRNGVCSNVLGLKSAQEEVHSRPIYNYTKSVCYGSWVVLNLNASESRDLVGVSADTTRWIRLVA